MKVKNIRRGGIDARQHAHSARGIDLAMVRGIDNRASTINEEVIILIYKGPSHISRPANSDAVLLSPRGKSFLKTTAFAVAIPHVIIWVVVAHPRPLLGL